MRFMQTPVLPPLTDRCCLPELMDQPGLDEQIHREALSGLARINWLSRGASMMWPTIRDTARRNCAGQLSVLDVACGSGDLAVAVKQRADRSGLRIDVSGCDISPLALEFAKERASDRGVAVRFFLADAIRDVLPGVYDVVTCSLFLHHLEQPAAITLLTRLAAVARQTVIINDLRRSRTGYWMALIFTRLLTRSHVVHVDGPLSVRAAFSLAEARELASAAGLEGAGFSRKWPQRFLMVWNK